VSLSLLLRFPKYGFCGKDKFINQHHIIYALGHEGNRKMSFKLIAGGILFFCLALTPVGLRAEDSIDFSLKTVQDGALFATADQKGKCLVVIFGSMYCKPCIEMIPVMNKLYETYKTSGFVAVGIDIDVSTDQDKLKSFFAEKNIRFVFLNDTNAVAKKYKVFVLPTILVVDGTGEIVKRFTGFQSYETLEKLIKKYSKCTM
jgi:thiol-disulfide isomerase/thioredoxin